MFTEEDIDWQALLARLGGAEALELVIRAGSFRPLQSRPGVKHGLEFVFPTSSLTFKRVRFIPQVSFASTLGDFRADIRLEVVEYRDRGFSHSPCSNTFVHVIYCPEHFVDVVERALDVELFFAPVEQTSKPPAGLWPIWHNCL